jgi:hypothetical protein
MFQSSISIIVSAPFVRCALLASLLFLMTSMHVLFVNCIQIFISNLVWILTQLY